MPLMAGTKQAYIEGWTEIPADPEFAPESVPDNYAVIIPEDVVVIDVDVKNFEAGDDPYARLCLDCGLAAEEIFDTYTVRVRPFKGRRDSIHVYFSKPAGVNLMAHHDEYGRGLEFLTKGKYVVGPGSIHPDAECMYTVINGEPSDLMPLPEALLLKLQRGARVTRGSGVYEDNEENRQRYVDFLATRAPAVQGDFGDEWTFKTACGGRDFGLPPEVTFDLMQLWNARCLPPWTPEDLWVKVRSAYRNSRDGIGNKLASAADFTKISPENKPAGAINTDDAVKQHQLILDRREADKLGNIRWVYKAGGDELAPEVRDLRPVAINVVNFFERPHYGSFVSAFYRSIQFNQFTQDIEIMRPMPWHEPGERNPGFWTVADTSLFRVWLARYRDFHPSENIILDGVKASAYLYQYHPLRQWLQSLKWDGKPRISKLFSHYAGAAPTAYVSEVSRCFMLAAVARVMTPGCKYDQLVILEGEQGTGKSTFCRTLGGDYYADLHIDPHNKDTDTNLLGKHVVELSELTIYRRSDADSIKAFLSRQTSRVRLPYDKLSVDLPRQCVLIATTNETTGYLTDRTGNRRSWPVRTGKIRIDELRRDREQLFAEAYYCWRAGEPMYIIDPVIEQLAKEEQWARTSFDPWTDAIAEFLHAKIATADPGKRVKVSTQEIAREALCIATRNLNGLNAKRISNCMEALGWEHARVYVGTSLVQGYVLKDVVQFID